MRNSSRLGNEILPVHIVISHHEWALRLGDLLQFKKKICNASSPRLMVILRYIFFVHHVQNLLVSISPLNPRDVLLEDFCRLLQDVFLVLCLCHVLLILYESFRPCLK